MENKISAVVLAAGKGTRINNGQPAKIPKVMYKLNGKPMIEYTVELLELLKIDDKILVVGYKKEMIEEYFSDRVKYAVQAEQNGTGHALQCGLSKVETETDHVLVLQGDDSAFYKPETIRDFINQHLSSDVVLSFITVEYPETRDIGRVTRDKQGNVTAIVEKEEMTEELWKFTEISAGFYCFKKDWLKNNITRLKPSTTGKGELIIPDLLKMALEQNINVNAYKLDDSSEWHGVNTTNQLKEARSKKGEVKSTHEV